MEVAPCVQEASSHAASLLASLNLQRERAQFCDCVVRQIQSPGQLHPAHRCVLAASSPVLASILSTTGALVELQAPCLSDSVLAFLLDYIYTGALPSTHSQHQYYNLLTAACHLQMDELQNALRALQTEVKTADNVNASNQPHEDKYLPSSLEKKDHQYPPNVDTCDNIDPCRSCSENDANHCSKKDGSAFCSISESTESSVNTGNCRPQQLIQNINCTTEVHRVSGVDKEVQKDPFHSAHSAGTVKPETWQRGTEDEPERTVESKTSSNLLCIAGIQEEETSTAAEEKQTNRKEEDKTPIRHSPLLCLSTTHLKGYVSPSQYSSSSSSSSPHPCCGAVPVICHSSSAGVIQLAEMSPMHSPYHPVSQAPVSSSRAPDPESINNESTDEGTTTRHKKHCAVQNQDCRNSKDHSGGWDYKHVSNQSDIIKQVCNCSNADDLIGQNDEHTSNGLSRFTDHNDGHAHCDSVQNKNPIKHFRDDSGPQNRDCSSFARRLKYKNDLNFEGVPSKHQRLEGSDCHNVRKATEEQPIRSQDPKPDVPLPVQDTDTGSGPCCGSSCAEGEAKEEDGYSRCPAETDKQDGHCNLDRTEASTNAAASSQHESDSDNTDRGMTDRSHVSTTLESCLDSVTGGLSGFERRTSMEFDKMSGAEITEPNIAFTVDHNMSDCTNSVVGPSYYGLLQYHCLPQEEAHLSYGYSGCRRSNFSHPDHSDQSSDEEEVGGFASPGYNPLRQHFATVSTDQVVLLDISAKPAELLVANAFSQKKTFGSGFGNTDREKRNEATSVAGVDTRSWVGEINVKERKSVSKDRSRPGAEVIHKARVAEGMCDLKEGDNQTTVLTVCSPPSVPDSLQASMSSTLSVCIPPTLPASTTANISAHLSNPVHHPFQCSLCDRSFSQRGSLNRHVRSHLGVRPFPCPRCPMTFSRQYRVTEHMRVHQRCVLRSDFQKPHASST
ncbi:hypothetical protein ABVT39_004252 [Epinephelus coioides]